MDFGTLLHTAQKNEKSGKKEPARYYSTKFEPPKKEQRNKQLSANIQRFLAKKEAEEGKKRNEANKIKGDLLALRAQDKKATRRVNVMLKRTKSANQSVIQDAVDSDNTSLTLSGPIQPDDDDYGYVSQEASAYYNKMMEKYSKMPNEPRFNLDKKKKVSTNLSSTKDRVRAAIEKEKEEANMPHRRKRKPRDDSRSTLEDSAPELEAPKPKKPRPPPPPTMNFNDLLKLAEKKQFEPIVVEQKPKEEEKLLTKKQKKEMEREKEWRDRKEGKGSILEKALSNKIPKVTAKPGDFKIPAKVPTNEPARRNPDVNHNSQKPVVKVPEQSRKSAGDKRPMGAAKPNPVPSGSSSSNNNKPSSDLRRREMGVKPPRDAQARLGMPPNGVKQKQFPPKDLKARPDARGSFPPRDVKRKPPGGMLVNKRRILDDDDEDYDSEMDDFIDDGPDDENNYSKYISEIFGYDKSRYRNLDDDVDNMESTFAQQMREECISAKIGIMEDLEDMKLEEEEKRKKALMKKNSK